MQKDCKLVNGVSVICLAANGQGFAQFDILQMKENRNAKWQIVTKPMLSAEGNSFLDWLFGGLFFKRKFCNHYFKVKDFQTRDENGLVKWKCSKCDKLFVATYGLKILENGTCDGQWGRNQK